MGAITTFGYFVPADGDRGQTLFDALEANWQRVNDHSHNGVNSAKLSSASIASTSQAISSANWALHTNGLYRQLISTVGGLLYENYNLMFRDSSNGDHLFLDTEKVGASQYYVYINDNTKDLTVSYT